MLQLPPRGGIFSHFHAAAAFAATDAANATKGGNPLASMLLPSSFVFIAAGSSVIIVVGMNMFKDNGLCQKDRQVGGVF